MFDFSDVYYNVVADMEVEPLFDGIEIKLAVDISEELWPDTTEDQDDAINDAMKRYARALEFEIADILGAELRSLEI